MAASLVRFASGENFGLDASLCVYHDTKRESTIIVALDPVYKGWQQIELLVHPSQIIIEKAIEISNKYQWILETKSGRIGVRTKDDSK